MSLVGSASPGGTAALLVLAPGRDPEPFRHALACAGWTVTVAPTPRTARDLAATTELGLVVVDAELPNLPSGLHPAVALRGGGKGGQPPRLVLVAAQVDARVSTLAAAAGAYRIALVPRGAATSAAPEATPPPRERAPAATETSSVWIVDDTPAIRLLARRAFERAGWQAAEFGELQSAKSALAAGARPTAVLLDIFLPDGNGLDHAANFVAAGAAVVMMSNLAGPDQVERAFAVGAADIVAKPVDMRSLVARVTRAVRWVEQGRQEGVRLQVVVPPVDDRQRLDALRL